MSAWLLGSRLSLLGVGILVLSLPSLASAKARLLTAEP